MNEKIQNDSNLLKQSLNNKCESKKDIMKQELNLQCQTLTSQLISSMHDLNDEAIKRLETSLIQKYKEEKLDLKQAFNEQCDNDKISLKG